MIKKNNLILSMKTMAKNVGDKNKTKTIQSIL